jgi:hypothetical protein
MKKKIITSSLLVILGIASMPTFATESIAFSLNVYPTCTGCHTSQNNADKGNLIPAAKTAYNQDKRTLSGLKTFLAASSVPAAPTCSNGQVLSTLTNTCVTPVPVCNSPQVLNAAKNVCETPAPVVPKCVLPQVLNAAKNVCETPAPVVPKCVLPQVLNAAKNVCETPAPVVPKCVLPQVLNTAKNVCETPTVTPTTKNTKPVLNSVAKQWDATVGELFTIPLSVNDAEQDEFTIIGKVAGSTLSAIHPDAAGLPSIDFEWTPTASQANKIFTITFQAKETKTTPKLISNKVSVKIRVWAANNRNSASVKTFAVTTSKFANGNLNLVGKVTLNTILTATEKKDFFAQKLDLTVSDKTGVLIGTTPLTLDANGNWSANLPANSSTCDIILQYEGKNAARTVAGCTKPVAAIAPPVTLANNSFDGESDDEGDDDDRNERKNNKRNHDD